MNEQKPKLQYMEPYTKARQFYISDEMWDWLKAHYATASDGVRKLVAEAMRKEEEKQVTENQN